MDDFEKELKICFLDEATQLLAEVEQCFLTLENNPKDEANLATLLRLAHNLKGSSTSVGFESLGHFTHELETFLLKVKNGQVEASAEVISVLLKANDYLSQTVEALRKDFDAKIDYQPVLNDIAQCVSGTKKAATAAAPPPPLKVETKPAPEVKPTVAPTMAPEERALNTKKIAEALAREHFESVQAAAAVEAQTGAVETNLPPPKEGHGPSNPSSPGSTDENIRVALSKVEKLINYVGEMVIIQSVLHQQAEFSESHEFKKTIHLLGKVGKEIQDISMGLRMVPIKQTFQRMTRIVRDVATSLNKEVHLNLVGEDTELDKTVLDKIVDPLVHLMRNSVDHGIESPEIRKSKGKPAEGQIHLRAFHRSGRLILEVADDGGGIDPQKLVKKAQEKGLIKANASLSDKEAYQLIFASGFSTKEQVSEISGRGVGMDVVKTNINELGGEIQIDSEVGKGTTFRVSLPLTLAIIESLIITYSNHKFIVPLGHVHETVSVKDYEVKYITGVGDVMLLRGENLRLVRLGDFFGIRSQRPPNEMIAIIVRYGSNPFAIMIDDIIGQHQCVVKRLSHELSGFAGVSGTTILGDGKPALILEMNDLWKRKVSSGYHPPKQNVDGGTAA